MGTFVAFILLIFLACGLLWYILSKAFEASGKVINQKYSDFQKKWKEDENE